MPRRACLGCIAVTLIAVITLAGCGKSDSSADAGKPGAPPAAPTQQVSGQSDLVGSWYTANPKERAEVIGLEFGKDGKVMLTMRNMQVVTCDYSVIDGGRVRIVSPDGQTMLFQCKVDPKSLLLDPEGPAAFSKMQLRRLSGQTIAEARKQEQEAEAKRRQEVLAAVQKQLEQSNLVLMSSDPSLKLSRFALDGKSQPGGWTGIIYSETNPPLARQAQMAVAQTDPPQVQISIGQVLGPVGEAQRNPMTITLTATGEGDKIELAEKGLALRSDAAAHDELIKKYNTVADARTKLINDFADQFKSYSHFEGELAYANNPNAKPRAVAYGLLRVEGKPQFLVADMTRNDNPAPEQFNLAAGVQLVNDKPILVIPQLQGQLQATTADGKTALEGQISGMAGKLAMTDSMTKDQLIARRALVTDFLDKQLPDGIQLAGQTYVDGKSNMPAPVMITLKGPAKSLAGVFNALHLQGTFTLTGQAAPTLLGAVVEFDSTHREYGKAPSTLLGSHRKAVLSVQWIDGHPKFSGNVAASFQSGPTFLDLTTPELSKSRMDTVSKLLSAGATFVVTDPRPRRNATPEQVKLKLDPATGKVEGQVITGNAWGNAAITGQFKESDGMPCLILHQEASTDRYKRPTDSYEQSLWTLFDDQGNLTLSGWSLSSNSNPPSVQPYKLVPSK